MQYLTYFRIKFITVLHYRAAALAGLLTQFFFGIVFIMVYLAFYESNPGSVPMPLESLVTYIWLGQAFYSLTYVFHREKDIISMIRNGDIAYELCKPGNLYLKWYSKIYATKLANVLTRFLPVIIITAFLPKPYNLTAPSSLMNFIGFLIILMVGSLLITGLITLMHVLTFYLIDGEGILNAFRVITELFAGLLVPIPFLPKFLQTISNYLPFQYMSDVPYRMYVGLISSNEILKIVCIQLFWIIVIFTIGLLLTKKCLKKVVVQGG